jgi:hypothetical protein
MRGATPTIRLSINSHRRDACGSAMARDSSRPCQLHLPRLRLSCVSCAHCIFQIMLDLLSRIDEG